MRVHHGIRLCTSGTLLLVLRSITSSAVYNDDDFSYYNHDDYYFEYKSMEYAAIKQTLDFEIDLGGIPNDNSKSIQVHNRDALSFALQHNASNNTITISNTFHVRNGVYGRNITNFILVVDGELKFHRGPELTYNHYNRVEPCILIEDSTGITLTSSAGQSSSYIQNGRYYGYTDSGDDSNIDTKYGEKKRGILDGNGMQWWGIPFWGYVRLVEERPDLLVLNRTQDILMEYLILKDAPLYTAYFLNAHYMTIRYTSIIARRTETDGHGLIDLSAFNTDGFDIAGTNIHVYDVDIWNQDDCIAVKDNPGDRISANMTFERVKASGLGLTIGSIGNDSLVNNITFRDSLLYKSYKGIYLKFRAIPSNSTARIQNILYENITIVEPEQWGIWIGPAQQAISGNVCKASPCSLCWPVLPFAKCEGSPNGMYKDITLRNISILNPLGSPGVILADETNPIINLTFDNVVVSRTIPVNLDTHFYALEQPITDHFVNWYLIFLYTSSIACLVMVPVYFLGRGLYNLINNGAQNSKRTMVKNDEKIAPLLSDQNISVLANRNVLLGICIAVSLAIFTQLELKTTSRTYNRRDYFSCRGVLNSSATGLTWPVPSCFVDATYMQGNNIDNEL